MAASASYGVAPRPYTSRLAQCGRHDRQAEIVLADGKQAPESYDDTRVDRRDEAGQECEDHRLVDDDVDVIKPVAQHRDGDSNGDDQHRDEDERPACFPTEAQPGHGDDGDQRGG
jgi:hypothetical protein